MSFEELRQYILEKSNIDVLSKKRVCPIPTAKKVFIQVAREKCCEKFGVKRTFEDIGSFLNLNHSTVIHHYKHDLKYDFIEYPILKMIFTNFFPETEKSIEDYKLENEMLKEQIKLLTKKQ